MFTFLKTKSLVVLRTACVIRLNGSHHTLGCVRCHAFYQEKKPRFGGKRGTLLFKA